MKYQCNDCGESCFLEVDGSEIDNPPRICPYSIMIATLANWKEVKTCNSQ